ncbi:MAG: small GTP-binding protein [Promethearchaeota archaeon CR_4]|nr:MAG: small GTP-binding protein [Candidatus Lokiarchaeota archaeon CR_4]
MTARPIGELLSQLLRNYQARVPSVKESMVFDRDGLILGGSRENTGSEQGKITLQEIFGTLASVIEPALSRIKTYKIGTFGTGIFDAEDYRLLFLESGPRAVFLTVLNYDAVIDEVLPYTYLVAERIASILEREPGENFLEIPEFIAETDGILFKHLKKDGDLAISPLVTREVAFKLIVLGDEKVGKTSLINSFVMNRFKDDYRSTLGINITEAIFNIQGLEDVQQRFLIYDVAGQKFFKRVRKHYYVGAHAAFLIYDVTERNSFVHLSEWYEDLRQNVPYIPVVLVGNKIDLAGQRQVTIQEGQVWAKNHKISFMETSAKTGQNIKDVFHIVGIGLLFTTQETASQITESHKNIE